MNSQHRVICADARQLADLPDASVQLVVTSPPYPMIEMWDASFLRQSEGIGAALASYQGNLAFDLMHNELDKPWLEVGRVLCDGCFACVNIGDATRSVGGRFRLFSNHSRIVQAFIRLGFDALPFVIWRKATNSPNKFMGSGMLPAGAYITLEHEYILIFRKGGKRIFGSDQAKQLRHSSAFFWEERNQWFSDLWDLKGVRQKLTGNDIRERSAAFPFELPYRLINMYSVYGDTVLDPFVGTGTTMTAAVAACRNSIGVEIEPAFTPIIEATVCQTAQVGNERITARVQDHLAFVTNYQASKGALKYDNEVHGFPVMTRQEKQLAFYSVGGIERSPGESGFCASHSPWNNQKGASDVTTRSLFADESNFDVPDAPHVAA